MGGAMSPAVRGNAAWQMAACKHIPVPSIWQSRDQPIDNTRNDCSRRRLHCAKSELLWNGDVWAAVVSKTPSRNSVPSRPPDVLLTDSSVNCPSAHRKRSPRHLKAHNSRWSQTTKLTLSPPTPLRLDTLPYWSNRPFLIFDIRALWRSGLSARAPKCQKLKMVG